MRAEVGNDIGRGGAGGFTEWRCVRGESVEFHDDGERDNDSPFEAFDE